MNPALMTDASLAAHLAEAAGRVLLAARSSGAVAAAGLGKMGDQIATRFLMAALREQRPDDGVVCEETQCDGTRFGKSRVWIIDPVDGTREYGEERADWAVHVGLAIDGYPAIGAVALPGLDGGLVVRSDQPSALPPPPERLRMVVSRSRPPAEAIAIAEKLDAELIPMGSAGAKAMALILGKADIYLHAGGQYEWDSMAPVAVAKAHGLHASRIDGSALRYNNADLYLPDLLIARKEHAQMVLDALRG